MVTANSSQQGRGQIQPWGPWEHQCPLFIARKNSFSEVCTHTKPSLWIQLSSKYSSLQKLHKQGNAGSFHRNTVTPFALNSSVHFQQSLWCCFHFCLWKTKTPHNRTEVMLETTWRPSVDLETCSLSSLCSSHECKDPGFRRRSPGSKSQQQCVFPLSYLHFAAVFVPQPQLSW